jgi:hypothetical protein
MYVMTSSVPAFDRQISTSDDLNLLSTDELIELSENLEQAIDTDFLLESCGGIDLLESNNFFDSFIPADDLKTSNDNTSQISDNLIVITTDDEITNSNTTKLASPAWSLSSSGFESDSMNIDSPCDSMGMNSPPDSPLCDNLFLIDDANYEDMWQGSFRELFPSLL